ncbi:MAG: hypothetical protein H6621_01625 [Halobacteriovoraceae bacterium]|nr:hypothetical protein [Halobacteriovoraceae bacterium]
MNEQKFLLWKLALSIIHLDGKVAKEEEQWFLETIEALKKNKLLNFNTQQIEELKNVLYQRSENLINDFNLITTPGDCAFLVHTINYVSQLDSHYSPDEKAIYEELKSACLKGIDLGALELELVKIAEHEEDPNEFYKPINPSSLFEKSFKFIAKILNSKFSWKE